MKRVPLGRKLSMKKVAGILVLMAIFCAPAMAQDKDGWKVFKKPPTKSRLELGGGVLFRSFSNITANGTPTGTRLDMVGWSGYADYRFLRWLSIGGDLSGAYHLSSPNGNTQIYTVMLGPQIYPFGHDHKITPFGHVLLGRGFYGFDLESQGGFNHFSRWDNSLAWMGGGGLDVKFKRHWRIRLIEFDYESTKFAAPGSPGYGNYRVTGGLLYRFGIK
jgi:outer membrane protein with beta-barrel domain